MAAEFIIPRWLLKKLDKEQKRKAKRMLFEEEKNIGEVARHFDIKHPSSGRPKRPYTIFNREQKIRLIQDLAKELGRTPSSTELPEYAPTSPAWEKEFGSWNNALRAAGLEPVRKDISRTPIKEVVEKIGDIPTVKDWEELSYEKWKEAGGHKKRWEKTKGKMVKDPEFKKSFLEKKRGQFHKMRQDPESLERIRASQRRYIKKKYSEDLAKKEKVLSAIKEAETPVSIEYIRPSIE